MTEEKKRGRPAKREFVVMRGWFPSQADFPEKGDAPGAKVKKGRVIKLSAEDALDLVEAGILASRKG